MAAEQIDGDSALRIDGDSAAFHPRLLLQIQSEEEWLRRHGLRAPHYGDESERNQLEAKSRYQDQISYQDQVHNKLFEEEQIEAESLEHEREKRLEEWTLETIDILTADSSCLQVNLKVFASHSDTIFTMADSRHNFHANLSKKQGNQNLSLSLEEYPHVTVQAFLQMLQETHLPLKESTISADHIIDSCRLAQYLQCTELLNKIVKILINEIDSENCMSLCQLADSLDLPGLMEASLGYVMKSLQSVESHDVWKELCPELQDKIKSIQALLKSNNRKSLYFSSFTEYVAVFAEQIQYYHERLTEAQIQQENHDVTSPGWAYAQSKIDDQKARVQTLNIMLREQKKIFLGR
jgi:hypothetical protein